jgi:hypothetical protein
MKKFSLIILCIFAFITNGHAKVECFSDKPGAVKEYQLKVYNELCVNSEMKPKLIEGFSVLILGQKIPPDAYFDWDGFCTCWANQAYELLMSKDYCWKNKEEGRELLEKSQKIMWTTIVNACDSKYLHGIHQKLEISYVDK